MESATNTAITDSGRGLRRRNVSLALAIVCLAVSCMFIFGYDGTMVWLMWRDAPLVSLLLVIAAVFFAVRWKRTPRS